MFKMWQIILCVRNWTLVKNKVQSQYEHFQITLGKSYASTTEFLK